MKPPGRDAHEQFAREANKNSHDCHQLLYKEKKKLRASNRELEDLTTAFAFMFGIAFGLLVVWIFLCLVTFFDW